jgi:ABC-2 type transport system ATP-binding protein
MNTIEVNHISKSFGPIQAVKDVSFSIQPGEIFGMLGPNGAGKTTTIRILLDIFKPDSGQTAILGGPMDEEKKNRIGYMPEERGLYQDIPLQQCLTYLGSLKGLSRHTIQTRLDPLLEQFDLSEHRRKKVKELSKGMQQKAQLISTILHQPQVLIIDEPFSGLDPVNTQAVKSLIQELSRQGTTILMSTHQMHQVEELCDRIVLINDGSNVLYGDLNEIRHEFSGHAIRLRTPSELPHLSGIAEIKAHNHAVQITLEETMDPQRLLQDLIAQGVVIEEFEVALPSLDEIFIQVVAERRS